MNSPNSFLKKILFNEFEDKFPNLVSTKTSFFGYFHGDHDEQTGASWCSDCDLAKPIIEESLQLLENQDKVLFVKFPIELNLWRDRQFLYRVHPKLRLEKVPTLIYYQNGVEFGRLTEGELFDKENVQEFFKQVLE